MRVGSIKQENKTNTILDKIVMEKRKEVKDIKKLRVSLKERLAEESC